MIVLIPTSTKHLLFHTPIFASILTTEKDFLQISSTHATNSLFLSYIFHFFVATFLQPQLSGCIFEGGLVRCSRACEVYQDFLSRARFTNKFFTQIFVCDIEIVCPEIRQLFQIYSNIGFLCSFVLPLPALTLPVHLILYFIGQWMKQFLCVFFLNMFHVFYVYPCFYLMFTSSG